ncbi:hypothetical protein [Arthrobacter sp. GMC3]|uniref:hypothetical protein n=1 Tax=Arthrobacter sp. GMC3 TaxID=2058894 RepID=UPI0015E3C568|nr:hypothetical protein [Arthrobacter sp. GMC3]
MTILVIATSSIRSFRLSIIDGLLFSFSLLLIVGWLLGWIQWGHLLVALIGWMIPYVGGRLISSRLGLQWIYKCLATGAVVASCLAIAEFLTGTNFFVLIKMNNSLYTTWHALQYRGGFLRVEGAFGHSIALGASLAMCSVFILVVPWPHWLRLSSLLIVAVAVGLTFSRIGLIGLALTLVVALFALRREMLASLRWKVAALFGLAAVLGLPLIMKVFASAGSEASGSAAYRTNIFSLIDTASLLGIAKSWDVESNGKTYFGEFQSIDSEIVLTALRFGLLPLLLLLAAILCCVVSVLRDRATPASVAVIGVIPAFATVAMITQYATLVWFLAGLAVASYNRVPESSLSTKMTVRGGRTSAIQYREEPRWLR